MRYMLTKSRFLQNYCISGECKNCKFEKVIQRETKFLLYSFLTLKLEHKNVHKLLSCLYYGHDTLQEIFNSHLET